MKTTNPESPYVAMNMRHPGNQRGMKRIHAEGLKDLMGSNANIVLIDARSHDSYDKEHIIGAISIPSDHLGEHVVEDFDKDTTFVTYCTDLKCEASTVAAKKLEKYGYANVLEYKEGIQDWKVHRYPTVKKGH